MKKFKFGIFDVDGNLVDSMPVYNKTFSRILFRRFGIPAEESNKYYLTSAGTPLNVQFRYMLENNNKSIENIEKMVEEFFYTVNQVDYYWYQGAKDLILDLRRKNFTLFVTTGSQTEVTKKKLEKAGMAKHFELILGSSEILKGPGHIKRFVQLVGLPIEEFSKQAFYCGDGPRDMEIAKEFGIYAIGVAQTVSKEKLLEAGADVVVNSIVEVMDLLK